ncbi:MAG: hypothetical protein GDA48_21750 [Hormoscilla sp. GM102CHS1]|nr:hypothetical protein [Hormoscilla sp. GM102CHS1]
MKGRIRSGKSLTAEVKGRIRSGKYMTESDDSAIESGKRKTYDAAVPRRHGDAQNGTRFTRLHLHDRI